VTRYAQRTLIQQPTLANWGKAAAGALEVSTVEYLVIAGGGGGASVAVVVAAVLVDI